MYEIIRNGQYHEGVVLTTYRHWGQIRWAADRVGEQGHARNTPIGATELVTTPIGGLKLDQVKRMIEARTRG